jgi:hypothetical protein
MAAARDAFRRGGETALHDAVNESRKLLLWLELLEQREGVQAVAAELARPRKLAP